MNPANSEQIRALFCGSFRKYGNAYSGHLTFSGISRILILYGYTLNLMAGSGADPAESEEF